VFSKQGWLDENVENRSCRLRSRSPSTSEHLLLFVFGDDARHVDTLQRVIRAKQSPFQAGQAQQEAQDPWQFEGRLHLQKGTSEGYLVLQMDLDQGHYIYSVNPKGSPAPTKISVVANPVVQTRGTFAPNVQPEVNENDPVFRRRIEKHKGQVQFFVPCQLDPNVDFQTTGMPVIEFNGQVCSADGVCIPINGQKVAVKFAGFFERENQSADKTAQPAASGEKQMLLDR